MQTRALELFHTIAEQKSYSKAAEGLFITPSALYQQIKLLEKEIGFKLFIGNSKGVQLTKSGQIFYEKTKRVLADVRFALEECRRIEDASSQVLNIACHSSVLQKANRQFARSNPDIRFNYIHVAEHQVEDILNSVKNGSVDIAQMTCSDRFEGYEGLCFFEIRSTWASCLISYNHPLSLRETLTFEDLKGETIHTFDIEGLINNYISKNAPYLTVQRDLKSKRDINNVCNQNQIAVVEDDYAKRDFAFSVVPITPIMHIRRGFVYHENTTPVVRQYLIAAKKSKY